MYVALVLHGRVGVLKNKNLCITHMVLLFAKMGRGLEGTKNIFLHRFLLARLGFKLTSQFGVDSSKPFDTRTPSLLFLCIEQSSLFCFVLF